nr:hypothetical protein GCM10020185_26080 [Pseudomonas brassicacearum subsp. brassicacearum]
MLDGDGKVNMFGLQHAREGDRVSCGKDGNTYQIRGGIGHMVSHGRHMAGTLDSHSTCPCKARLIPSVFWVTYKKMQTPHRKPAESLNWLNDLWERACSR